MWVIMECLLIGSAMKPKSLKEGAIRRVCVACGVVVIGRKRRRFVARFSLLKE